MVQYYITYTGKTKEGVNYFYNIDPICSKIKMFSKFHDKYVKPITSNNRYTVRSISIPTYPVFNLMCLHFQSKVNWDFADQAAHSMELNTVINDFEKKTKNKRGNGEIFCFLYRHTNMSQITLHNPLSVTGIKATCPINTNANAAKMQK